MQIAYRKFNIKIQQQIFKAPQMQKIDLTYPIHNPLRTVQHPQYKAQLLISIVAVWAFNRMLVHDNNIKKTVFIFIIAYICIITKVNGHCARTAWFLMCVVLGQTVLVGACVGCKDIIVNYVNNTNMDSNIKKENNKNSTKKKNCRNCQNRLIFTMVILVLSSTSIIGFFVSLINGYYLQLLQPELPYMLAIVLLAFLLVFVADYVYVAAFAAHRGLNKQGDSGRRKIFHFVPLVCVPIVVNFNYRLFSLMAIGSYYLFWLIQLIRYYGKLAINPCQNIDTKQRQDTMNICYLEQPMKKKNSKLMGILGLLHQSNTRLSKTAFINWMQSLNSDRQHYFWFTHLSLILGLALTYLYYGEDQQQYSARSMAQLKLKQNISIILVISDAMAAIIGRKYGSVATQIPYTNKKTIQGYMAYTLTSTILQFALYMVIICVYPSGNVLLDNINVRLGILVIVSSVVCGAAELFSGDLDNIVCGFAYIVTDWVLAYV